MTGSLQLRFQQITELPKLRSIRMAITCHSLIQIGHQLNFWNFWFRWSRKTNDKPERSLQIQMSWRRSTDYRIASASHSPNFGFQLCHRICAKKASLQHHQLLTVVVSDCDCREMGADEHIKKSSMPCVPVISAIIRLITILQCERMSCTWSSWPATHSQLASISLGCCGRIRKFFQLKCELKKKTNWIEMKMKKMSGRE